MAVIDSSPHVALRMYASFVVSLAWPIFPASFHFPPFERLIQHPSKKKRQKACIPFLAQHNVLRTRVVLSEYGKLFSTVRKEEKIPLFMNFLLEGTAFVGEPSYHVQGCAGNFVKECSTSHVRLPCSWRITIIIRIRKRVPLQDNIKVMWADLEEGWM